MLGVLAPHRSTPVADRTAAERPLTVCFSAEADLVAGVVVGAIGVDVLRHVHRRSEIPLATLPLVLAVHQVTESFVWWGLDGRVAPRIGHLALWIYLAIAFGVLPVLAPLAVSALEPPPRPRRLRVLLATGAGVAAVLMHSVVRGPVEAAIDGHHIAYRVALWHGGYIVAAYVVATCGAMLLSSNLYVRRFGLANLGAVTMLAWLDKTALISLWCAWAAVTSISIAAHLRHAGREWAHLGALPRRSEA